MLPRWFAYGLIAVGAAFAATGGVYAACYCVMVGAHQIGFQQGIRLTRRR